MQTQASRYLFLSSIALLFFCLIPASYAQLAVISNPIEIDPEGTNEKAGNMRMEMYANIFENASPGNPHYIRIEMPEGVMLSNTVVGVGESPVYLAIHLLFPADGTLQASPTALAVVRWVAGESAIWIRITESSTGWARNARGDQQPAGFQEPVFWLLGLDRGESSAITQPFFEAGFANLPANTTQANQGIGAPEAPTPFLLDVSNADFSADNAVATQVDIFVGSEGVDTEVDPTNIENGTPLSIVIDNSLPIAFVQTGVPPRLDLLLASGIPNTIPGVVTCATAGILKGSISDAAFPTASEANPVTIRVELSLNNELCETLVDPNNPNLPPINIALKNDLPSDTIQANPDALQIVRWKADEGEFWLRVNQSTLNWGTNPALLGRQRFDFQIGLDGLSSLEAYESLFQSGEANLPANTSDLEEFTPTDTLIKVNLFADSFNSSLRILWAELDCFANATGVTTEPNPNLIDPGNGLGISAYSLIAFLDETTPIEENGIHISSVLRDLEPGHPCQPAGNYTMELNADEFADASSENPIYVQLSLENNVRLCETLVEPGSDEPLYIAMNLDSLIPTDTVAAAPESLSIVRWVAGEQDIWLRVSTSSSTWIQTEDKGLVPPEEFRTLRWSLGVSAQVSFEQNSASFERTHANLPANSFDANATSQEDAADTAVRVDLTEATMTPALTGWNGLLPNQPRTWSQSVGVETLVDPELIDPGDPLDIVFYGLRDIAKSELAIPEKTVIMRGLESPNLRTIPATDVEVDTVIWTNPDTGNFKSGRSVVWDPLPDDPKTRIRADITDRYGRRDQIEVLILSYPDGVDLNQNGFNDLCDLHIAAQDWPNSRSVLELSMVRIDTTNCENKARNAQ